MKTVRETVRRRNSHSTKHLISLVGPALIAFFKISTNWPKTPLQARNTPTHPDFNGCSQAARCSRRSINDDRSQSDEDDAIRDLLARLQLRTVQLVRKLSNLVRGYVVKLLEVVQEVLLVAHREYARLVGQFRAKPPCRNSDAHCLSTNMAST